jgi:hypothetical protein
MSGVEFLKLQNGCTFSNTVVFKTARLVTSKHQLNLQFYVDATLSRSKHYSATCP